MWLKKIIKTGSNKEGKKPDAVLSQEPNALLDAKTAEKLNYLTKEEVFLYNPLMKEIKTFSLDLYKKAMSVQTDDHTLDKLLDDIKNYSMEFYNIANCHDDIAKALKKDLLVIRPKDFHLPNVEDYKTLQNTMLYDPNKLHLAEPKEYHDPKRYEGKEYKLLILKPHPIMDFTGHREIDTTGVNRKRIKAVIFNLKESFSKLPAKIKSEFKNEINITPLEKSIQIMASGGTISKT